MDRKRKEHWEAIYATTTRDQVSWTQDVPAVSLEFIHSFDLPRSASIIDIGGGESKLVDHLLDEGFENISVLDISAAALDRTKMRLGERAKKIEWIVSDILEFRPAKKFDLWHDRATFHFLTSDEDIATYVDTVTRCVTGDLVIGTFSMAGPKKCSGLDVRQYSEDTLNAQFGHRFRKIRCRTEDHITPSNASQNFIFCSFERVPS